MWRAGRSGQDQRRVRDVPHNREARVRPPLGPKDAPHWSDRQLMSRRAPMQEKAPPKRLGPVWRRERGVSEANHCRQGEKWSPRIETYRLWGKPVVSCIVRCSSLTKYQVKLSQSAHHEEHSFAICQTAEGLEAGLSQPRINVSFARSSGRSTAPLVTSATSHYKISVYVRHPVER
jgi:hypothetical protein